MRVSLFFLMFLALWVMASWLILSSPLFLVSMIPLLAFIVITVCWSDAAVLFFLGARELRSGDAKAFFEASSQEAYKLGVPLPQMYFYNGSLQRAFVLENRKKVSLVVNKNLIDSFTGEELRAISFELLLQVKKGMARKRTKIMFFIGFVSWVVHSISKIILMFLPGTSLKKSFSWIVMFFITPFFELIFKMTIGKSYFKKIKTLLNEFPKESDDFKRVGLKINQNTSYNSLASRKVLELTSVDNSRNFQSMMLIEFLPHEWDYIFQAKDESC